MREIRHDTGEVGDSVYLLAVKRREGQESGKILVGRFPNCDFQLNRSTVSRKQASFYCDCHGKWMVNDEKSRNSTWLKV